MLKVHLVISSAELFVKVLSSLRTWR